MGRKEQLNKKILRQQELVNGAKAAGREFTAEEKTEFDSLQREIDTLKLEIVEEERAAHTQTESERAIQEERQRASEINALCRDFGVPSDDFLKNGTTVDQVRAQVLEKLKAERTPSTASFEIKGGKDETEKIRAAASDAILMRAGKTVDKPADGAMDMRGMKLRDLAIDCLIRAGVSNAHRLNDDELYRRALSPDSQFAGILDDSVNKSMATAYRAAQTTYQAWTGRGSNPDFKAATHYQISEAGELVPMTQSGEFKFDEMSDNGVSKALATFGRKFGLTRQAMINDDISILTKVPEAYVRAAGRGINKLVYKMLGSNPAIYDGKNLFHADHGNLGIAGIPSVATLGELRKLMRKQKNLRGKETLNISPKNLIVPAALETDAEKLLISVSDPAANNSGVANVFKNSFTLVVDAELDSYSEKSYYVAADPGDIDTIEVTYLNGDDMPKLESRVGFDFLGMEWRI
ncbi:MAG TPA: Mu-like prophage major head subunit gpT family protein, partial [Negativicutes bacterium]|nr:Mu-like prophage major head subunit gpT family protein [Negativicutes bacterium]